MKRYKYPHTLVLIDTNDHRFLENIEVFKFGKDSQLPEGMNALLGDYPASYACLLCRKTGKSNTFRWICLNCRPGPLSNRDGLADICHACFLVSKDYKNPNYKELMRTLITKEGHEPSHILLRLLFPGNHSYYEYWSIRNKEFWISLKTECFK